MLAPPCSDAPKPGCVWNKLTQLHPFDQALVLEPQGDGVLLGQATPAWANMVGPFGGITAATVVRAIMDHAQCLGTPLSLTINYVAGIALGPYHLHLSVARTNRSTAAFCSALFASARTASSVSLGSGGSCCGRMDA